MATVRKLGNLIFDEVSLVDRPANQHGLVVFAKADTKESGAMGFYTADGQPIDPDDVEIGERVYNDDGDEFVGAEIEDDDDVVYVDEDGNEVDLADYEFEEEGELVGKRLSDVFLEDLSKALTQDGRDAVIAKALGRMETIEKANRDLTYTVRELIDANDRRDYTEIAKNYDLPFDPEDMGGLLQRLSKSLSPQDMQSVGQILNAGSEYARQASLLEIGYAGGAPSSVYDQVAGAAADVVAKSYGDVGFEDATTAFFEANPEAYDEYEAEQRENYR